MDSTCCRRKVSCRILTNLVVIRMRWSRLHATLCHLYILSSTLLADMRLPEHASAPTWQLANEPTDRYCCISPAHRSCCRRQVPVERKQYLPCWPFRFSLFLPLHLFCVYLPCLYIYIPASSPGHSETGGDAAAALHLAFFSWCRSSNVDELMRSAREGSVRLAKGAATNRRAKSSVPGSVMEQKMVRFLLS